jgi:hypothetical protein
MITKKTYKKSFTDTKKVFYINSDGNKVTCFSSFEIVNNELQKLNISTKDITINELLYVISLRILNEYANSIKLNQNDFRNENKSVLKVLYMNIQEVAFYLYDFDTTKMPNGLRESYQYQYPIKKI